MLNFVDIILKHQSDKVWNGYGPVYDSCFKNIRFQKIDLLEIGIGTIIPTAPSNMCHLESINYQPGSSLRAFQEYFPNAAIYGGDIQDDCMISDQRIKTFKFDSTDKQQCDHALKDLSFDIIIDDGLHTADAQYTTLMNLWHRVKPGGFYFIEDVWRPLYDNWKDIFATVKAEKFSLNIADKYCIIVFSK